MTGRMDVQHVCKSKSISNIGLHSALVNCKQQHPHQLPDHPFVQLGDSILNVILIGATSHSRHDNLIWNRNQVSECEQKEKESTAVRLRLIVTRLDATVQVSVRPRGASRCRALCSFHGPRTTGSSESLPPAAASP
jgi:hypothetical protein